jgi:hypothetical protein
MRLIKSFFTAFLILLTACGDDPASNSDSVAKTFNEALINGIGGDATAAQCGQGGSSCPDGFECASFSGDREMCVLIGKPAVVLLKDATLGGGCLMHSDKDRFPGVSVGSIEILAMDRTTVIGHGRMVWDKAGYEVARDRGQPADGTKFTSDICTDSYNLGCDGLAIFEIVDEKGAVQDLREGQSLLVQARGKESCGEEFADGIAAWNNLKVYSSVKSSFTGITYDNSRSNKASSLLHARSACASLYTAESGGHHPCSVPS